MKLSLICVRAQHVTREEARRCHAHLKVDAYERMHAERPDDNDVGLQLMRAREDLEALHAATSETAP